MKVHFFGGGERLDTKSAENISTGYIEYVLAKEYEKHGYNHLMALVFVNDGEGPTIYKLFYGEGLFKLKDGAWRYIPNMWPMDIPDKPIAEKHNPDPTGPIIIGI